MAKTIIKTAILFLFVLLTVSMASAHGHHHYRNYNLQDQYTWKEYELYEYPDYNIVDLDVPVEPVTPAIKPKNASYTLDKIRRNNTYYVGGNGQALVLKNYKTAKNPSYNQLLAFLKVDKTDEIPYTSNFVCSDFAVRVHNNAEKAGIKMGWCCSKNCNHAWNVVNTTDKGIVYIDCTGVSGGARYQDKILNVKENKQLTGKFLFKDGTVNYGCHPWNLVTFW